MNCRREKIRKKAERISLNKVGEASGQKKVLEAPREKMKNLLLHRVM
jgi:hypothetical protein